MVYRCTACTDLEELIGSECWEGEHLLFRYGPLTLAMKHGEELVLENSGALSMFTLAKVRATLETLFIDETSESIRPGHGFHLILR